MGRVRDVLRRLVQFKSFGSFNFFDCGRSCVAGSRYFGPGGMVMLIKQHAMELAPNGITVYGVAPTFVYTEMIRHVTENPEFRQGLLDRIPLAALPTPRMWSAPP